MEVPCATWAFCFVPGACQVKMGDVPRVINTRHSPSTVARNGHIGVVEEGHPLVGDQPAALPDIVTVGWCVSEGSGLDPSSRAGQPAKYLRPMPPALAS